MMHVFTDGSHRKRDKRSDKFYAGYGIIFVEPLDDDNISLSNGSQSENQFNVREIAKVSRRFSLINPTIIRAELYAVYSSLKRIYNQKYHLKYDEIKIYSDSMYTVNCVMGWIDAWIKSKWKNNKIKNLDILKKMYNYLTVLKKHCKITCKHVSAHGPNSSYRSCYNNHADVLAKNGCKLNKKIK